MKMYKARLITSKCCKTIEVSLYMEIYKTPLLSQNRSNSTVFSVPNRKLKKILKNCKVSFIEMIKLILLPDSHYTKILKFHFISKWIKLIFLSQNRSSK